MRAQSCRRMGGRGKGQAFDPALHAWQPESLDPHFSKIVTSNFNRPQNGCDQRSGCDQSDLRMASSPSNHGTMASSSANAADLQLVSRYWSDFDLEGMRASLDEVGLRVAEHQEEAMQNRKKLAESTKAFRSQYADDPNTKAYGTLLKTYQEEIDKYGCPQPMLHHGRISPCAWNLIRALCRSQLPLFALLNALRCGGASHLLQADQAREARRGRLLEPVPEAVRGT